MSLLLSNGVMIVMIAIMPLKECKKEADRINADLQGRGYWAFCEVINER